MSNQTLYDRIKILCDRKGMDVEALEFQMGYPKGTFWRWRKSQPSKWRIREVAEALGVPEEVLYETT